MTLPETLPSRQLFPGSQMPRQPASAMTTRSTASTEVVAATPAVPASGLSARRAGLHLALVLAVVGVGAGLLGGAPMAQSAVLGVLLAAINLLAMRHITRAMTEGGSAVWALVLPVKLIALVGVAYLLVRAGLASAIPLAVGFAVLPLTSVFLPPPSSVRRRA